MSKSVFPWLLGALALCGAAGAAEPARPATKVPARMPAGFMDRFKQQSRSVKLNHTSAATKGMIRNGANESSSRLPTFPNWRGSFRYQGTNYPYVMAGGAPRRGDETRLDTSIIFLDFKFDEFADAKGNSLVIRSNKIVKDVLGSPNLVASDYSVGFAQFGDAVQRASFFDIADDDWHTTLRKPRTLTPVTIEVPVGQADVFDIGGGRFVGIVNFDFLYSQIQTILQLEGVKTDELPMLVSGNVFADQALGFHDAIEVESGGKKGIQTYLWTSWLDEDAFGPIFADATTLTHEVSEWIADPFIDNIVPDYVIPESGGFCQNVLEVGDPIEFLDTQEFDVVIGGHTYHTQNETMLAWFSRQSPSTAFNHGYSYPATDVLTTFSDPCPTP